MLNWKRGRSGGGYEVATLFNKPLGLPFDAHLLRMKEGSWVPAHRDPAPGRRHYRLNVELRQSRIGGRFYVMPWEGQPTTRGWPLFSIGRRAVLFRSDITEHGVSIVVEGPRLVLSLGWAPKDGEDGRENS